MENLLFGRESNVVSGNDFVGNAFANDMHAAIIPASDLHLVLCAHRVHHCPELVLVSPERS
jgi:hypothetical protein